MQTTKKRTMKCQVAVASPHLASAEGQYLGHLEPCPGHEQRRKTPRAQCPGSVPALPVSTDGWALISVPDSSGWLKLPKGVECELILVNMSILLLKFGVWLARDKGQVSCNTDRGTNQGSV